MKDPKGVSGLSFTIDSMLEPLYGTATDVSGQITLDEQNLEKSTGKIVIQTASVRLAAENISSAMQGDWCLAPTKYPTIEFSVKKLMSIRREKEGVYSAKALGDFTLHGVTKEMTVEATVTRLPDKLKTRGGMPGKEGDLLVLRSNFDINRRDFGLAPDLNADLVGDVIAVRLSCVGVSPR